MNEETSMISRRNVLASGAAMLTAGAASLLRRNPLLAAASRRQAGSSGKGKIVPVVTPNTPSMPWSWEDGYKTFHLIAEPVKREFAPGLRVNCWGYNGQTPGPDHRSGRGRPGADLRHEPACPSPRPCTGTA